jgi:hypothetical protein
MAQQNLGNSANLQAPAQTTMGAPQNTATAAFGLSPLMPSSVAPTSIGWGGYQGQGANTPGSQQSSFPGYQNQQNQGQQAYQQNLGGSDPTRLGYQRSLAAGG